MILVLLLGGLVGTIAAIAGVTMHGLHLEVALINYFAGVLSTIIATAIMVPAARLYPRLLRFLHQQ